MNKFSVTIEEHISQTFTVQAKNMEDAMEIAEEKYKNGEFVIGPNVPTARLMMAEDKNSNDSTDWVEF